MLTSIIDRLGQDVKSVRGAFYKNVLSITQIKCLELPGWHQEIKLYCLVIHYLEKVFQNSLAQLERLERSKGLQVRPLNTNYNFKAIVSNPQKNTDYVVTNEYSEWTCTCPDHHYRHWNNSGELLCKHILAAKIVQQQCQQPEDKTVTENRKLLAIVNTAIANTSLKVTEVDLKHFRVELSQNGEKVAEIGRHNNQGKFWLRRPFQQLDYFTNIENALKIVLHVHNFSTGKSFSLIT